jgi:hypothetical protein
MHPEGAYISASGDIGAVLGMVAEMERRPFWFWGARGGYRGCQEEERQQGPALMRLASAFLTVVERRIYRNVLEPSYLADPVGSWSC